MSERKPYNNLNYTEAGIRTLLERVDESIKGNYITTLALSNHLARKGKKEDIKGFSRNNWKNILANKEKYCSGTHKMNEFVFNEALYYLNKNQQGSSHYDSEAVGSVVDNLHYAMCHTLEIPFEDPQLRKKIEGYYVVYKPSTIVRGQKNQKLWLKSMIRFISLPSGGLAAKEIMRYIPSGKVKPKRQIVKGYLWKREEKFFIIGVDSDTEFIRSYILKRYLNRVNGTLEGLSGACTHIDSSTPYMLPIFLERINLHSYSELRNALKSIGYIRKEDIPSDALARLDINLKNHVAEIVSDK